MQSDVVVPVQPTTSTVRPQVVLAGAWVAFWMLIFLLGVQEYRWSGGGPLWPLAVEYGTAAVTCTILFVVQMRRAPRFDGLLMQPLRWFAQLWKWVLLEMAGFLIPMFGIPRVANVIAGVVDTHHAWVETSLYELLKFSLFYILLGCVQFGVRSSRALAAEQLRAEHQARLAREAQLVQLTQQLRPHFLFNAINTVSSLIHSDAVLADRLLTRLAVLLRAATNASLHAAQPLSKELELLRAYAEIMTERFSDRVDVSWDIGAGCLDCSVPTLGLQGLLENCFVHGVERHRSPMRITVRARRVARCVCIEVVDDGEPSSTAPEEGVGIGNLRRRLEFMHGSAATLMLLPGSGGGFTVRLELPCE